MAAQWKNEILWVSYYDEKGKPVYKLTSNKDKDWWYLYDVSGEEPVKLGKDRSPILLENKFKVNERLLGVGKERKKRSV